MKILIDTNILIPMEPASPNDLEPSSRGAAALSRLAALAGSKLYLHPAQRQDIASDLDPARQAIRKRAFEKYPCIRDAPPLSESTIKELGQVEVISNDYVDHLLLEALRHDAIDLLVTNDRRLRLKAARLGLVQRVMDLDEALACLQALFEPLVLPPPLVRETVPHALDLSEPFFDSLKNDYPEFPAWYAKACLQERKTWVIRDDSGKLAALVIVKPEDDAPVAGGQILKICTFKVSEEFFGRRFGELLLKTVFSYVESNGYDTVYLTVFERHGQLLSLLDDFGFLEVEGRSARDELIFSKRFVPTAKERLELQSLRFNILFGPSAVKLDPSAVCVIPIQPRYHQMLFPEAEAQVQLFPRSDPFGNGLRKAYLCHSSVRHLSEGTTALFYRSQDSSCITALGVTEEILVSDSAEMISRFVGKRTVYSFEEIRKMCERQTLAILFRQARILSEPVRLPELLDNGILRAAPQSITFLAPEAVPWITSRLQM